MKSNYSPEKFKTIINKIKNPDTIEKINIQELYNTNKVFKEKIRRMFSKINHRKYKVNINVTILDILEKIQECNMYCSLTSIKMDFSGWNGISVDRIDSNKDYTKDNIQIVCWCINCSKNTYTNEEFKEFLNKIKNEN